MIPFVETDYLTVARSRYTQQFKDKPVFDAYIKIVIQEIEELQAAFKDLKQLRDLDSAVGVQLDVIGDIVGQPRVLVDFTLFPFFGFLEDSSALGFSSLADPTSGGILKSLSDSDGEDYKVDDETYRFILRARIVANISNTTPQGVIDAVNYIVGRTDSNVEEVGNAHLKITHNATLTPLQDYFLRGLSSVGSIIPLPICVSYSFIDKNATVLLAEDGSKILTESGSKILGE